VIVFAVRLALGIVLAVGAPRVGAASAGDRPSCRDLAILASPAAPVVGSPLRIVVAADMGTPAEVVVEDASGRVLAERVPREGPRGRRDDGRASASGTYRVSLQAPGAPTSAAACWCSTARRHPRSSGRRMSHGVALRVEPQDGGALRRVDRPALRRPAGRRAELPSLDPVLRDPDCNFLHDHLRLGEDGPGNARSPPRDCADLRTSCAPTSRGSSGCHSDFAAAARLRHSRPAAGH
jgi:hypothetical protein